MISDGPASMLPVNRKVDKCEIWFFLHLTALRVRTNYPCTASTTSKREMEMADITQRLSAAPVTCPNLTLFVFDACEMDVQ